MHFGIGDRKIGGKGLFRFKCRTGQGLARGSQSMARGLQAMARKGEAELKG